MITIEPVSIIRDPTSFFAEGVQRNLWKEVYNVRGKVKAFGCTVPEKYSPSQNFRTDFGRKLLF